MCSACYDDADFYEAGGQKRMHVNAINGWREVLARVFDGFEVEYGLTPEWLVNPETNRRLKLDYFYPEIGVAVRFVGLEGSGRRPRKSDEEVDAEARREDARAAVCREHGVVLVSVDPEVEPRTVLRSLETGLARASSQVARAHLSQDRKQRLMQRLSEARRKAGEFTPKLATPERLNLYAEMWRDREASLATQAPQPARPAPRQNYRQGMRVLHDRFGPGSVVAVAPEAGDVKVSVEFDDATARSFYASLVGGGKLQVVSD
jgi:hypothetical protein